MRMESSGGMEWLAVWTCNSSGSDSWKFRAWSCVRIGVFVPNFKNFLQMFAFESTFCHEIIATLIPQEISLYIYNIIIIFSFFFLFFGGGGLLGGLSLSAFLHAILTELISPIHFRRVTPECVIPRCWCLMSLVAQHNYAQRKQFP